MEKLYVVGNVFKNIAEKGKVITIDEAMAVAKKAPSKSTELLFEQGVSEEQIDELNKLYQSCAVSPHFITYFDESRRCPGELTHKKKSYNTLISEPEKITDETFKCLLMIDERCADLSDHVTGKHIQFMVLVEAARQMVNAVTEKFYAESSMIYLANNLNVKFESFIYPFRTELIYHVREKKIKIGGNGKMNVEVDFLQKGKILCTLGMTFTILNRDFVTKIEENSLKAVTN